MSNFTLDDAKKNRLLNMASKQLGTDPNTLRKQLDAGNVQEVMAGLDQESKDKISGVLQNPDALKALLGNEQVRALLKNLKGE